MEGHVTSHVEHGINTIEFYHPQRNSLPARILELLASEIHAAGLDDHTRVIILRSAGEGTFCAGASFTELSAIKTESEGIKFFSGFANVINAMRKCPKLIIARLQGQCIGGGMGLAAAADYCIAWEGCEVRLSELSFGIGPFVVGPAVERKIGLSAFSQLAIDSNLWRNYDWAKKKGLFAEVHPSIENMDESVYRLANTLAHMNPDAMKEMKKVFWQGTEHWDDLLRERAGISGRLVLSSYTKEAIEKFNKKKAMAG